MRIVRIALACLLLAVPAAGPAAAWTVGAGWTNSDVGLDGNGDGIWLGVGNRVPLKGVLDLGWSVDYVQKKGVQPMTFSDPVAGFVTDEARVNLHFVQPAAFLGATLGNLPLRPRPYVGAAFGLKVEESWNEFPGTPSTKLAYKDSDFVAQIGLGLGIGPVELDARYMKGFGGSLILDQTARGQLKAEEDLPGVDPPRIGAKLETFAVGVVFPF